MLSIQPKSQRSNEKRGVASLSQGRSTLLHAIGFELFDQLVPPLPKVVEFPASDNNNTPRKNASQYLALCFDEVSVCRIDSSVNLNCMRSETGAETRRRASVRRAWWLIWGYGG
jgi:hypothetical protein